MQLRLDCSQPLLDLGDPQRASLLHLDQLRALRNHPAKQHVFHEPREVGDQPLAHNLDRARGPLFSRIGPASQKLDLGVGGIKRRILIRRQGLGRFGQLRESMFRLVGKRQVSVTGEISQPGGRVVAPATADAPPDKQEQGRGN